MIQIEPLELCALMLEHNCELVQEECNKSTLLKVYKNDYAKYFVIYDTKLQKVVTMSVAY